MPFNPLNLNKIGIKSIYDRYKYTTDDTLAEALATNYFDLTEFDRTNKTNPIVEILASDDNTIISIDDLTGVSFILKLDPGVNKLVDPSNRDYIVNSENVEAANLKGKYGFRGNGSDANAYLPAALNGKYTVEFLVKVPDPTALNRLIDFRHNSGDGFISISNGMSVSSGRTYVNNVDTSAYAGSQLQQVQVQGMDIVAERVTILSSAFNSGYTDSFMSDLKIFDYYTGALLHRWKLSETSELPVNDEVGVSVAGAINNYYSTFPEQTKEPYINTYRWLAWRIAQVQQTDCLITHDDGYVEMETIVAPLLKSKSMIANVGVVKDYVEGSNVAFMRESSLATLKNTYGFAIVNHTESHQSIATLLASDADAAAAEITNCQTYLNALGFDGDYFIYALSNSANSKTRILAQSLGIKLARLPSVSDWQKVPPIRALELTPISTNNIQVATTLGYVFDLIDFVVASGGVIITYNHNVQSDSDALAASYSNTTGITFYTQLINRLVGVNAKTITMKEFEAKYSSLML